MKWPQRLLLAEDDVEMRRWLGDVLHPLGMRASEAGNGFEALTLLAQKPFDLVVTDFRMPAPNGLQLLAWARSKGLVTPFIVISAFGDTALVRSVADHGSALLLKKPFGAEALIAVADEIIFGQPVHSGTTAK